MADYTTQATAGSVTEPDGLEVVIPSVETKRFFDSLPLSAADWTDTWRGVFLCNGHDPVRHIVDGSVLDTGLLPPSPASDMTATPDGTQATATFDTDYDNNATGTNPSNAHYLGLHGYLIKFVSSLSATPAFVEVLIGGSVSDTLDNLEEVIADTDWSNDGVKYQQPSGSAIIELWRSSIEVSANDGLAITFRSIQYGTVGNSLDAFLSTTDTSWGSPSTNFSFGSNGNSPGLLGKFTGGADSGAGPGPGDFDYAYRYYRSTDGAYSAISDKTTINQGTSGSISLASMTASGDSDVDFTEWMRTVAYGLSLYPGARFPNSGTSDTDTILDADIVDTGLETYDPALFRPYISGPIPRFRHCVVWKGRLWGGGVIRANDLEGLTVSLTSVNDSVPNSYIATIDLTTPASYAGPYATEDWIGRTIIFGDGTIDTNEYIIVDVNEATGAMTLNKPWAGSTGTGNPYKVVDRRNPLALWFSEPLLPNQFPPQNEILISAQDADGITGIIPHYNRLIVFTRTSMWEITGDDLLSFTVTKISENVGCVSGQTIKAAEGGIFWLGHDGIYGWAGGLPEKISSPQTVGDSVSGIDATINRINWAHEHLAFARYCQRQRVYECYVPLDDAVVPGHAIVLDLGTRGTFSLDRVADYSFAGNALDESGDPICLAGDAYGNTFQLGLSTSDGAYGYEPVQTLSGSQTVRTLTVSGTPFTTDECAGLPVLVLTGGSVVQSKIVSNTDNDLVLDHDLDTAPSDSDQIVVGGIHMVLETGKFDLGETRRWKILKHVVVIHSPESDGQYHFAASSDQTAPAIPTRGWTSGDFTETSARRLFRPDGNRGILHQLKFQVFEPGITAALLGYEIAVTAREPLDL